MDLDDAQGWACLYAWPLSLKSGLSNLKEEGMLQRLKSLLNTVPLRGLRMVDVFTDSITQRLQHCTMRPFSNGACCHIVDLLICACGPVHRHV